MPIPAGLLNQSATIMRSMGEVRDGRGGFQNAPPTLVGTAAVRLNPAGAAETTRAQARGVVLSHVAYVLPSADLRRGDYLEIGDRVYEVIAVERPSVPDFYQKALAQETQRKAKPA